MLKKILIGLVVIIVGFLAYAATRPGTYHVERSTTIDAPPDVALNVVGDFHRFGEWSPWEKLDPTMTKTYEGPAGTVGSSYAWVGNKQVGEGKMTITEVQPDHVSMKLDFIKPYAATSDVKFTSVSEGNGSRFTWTMDGKNNYMSKVMSVFMSMDKMVGKDFDAGLANLKPVAEASAKTMAAAPTGAGADSTTAGATGAQ